MRLEARRWIPCVTALTLCGCGGGTPEVNEPALDRGALHGWDDTSTRDRMAGDDSSGARASPRQSGDKDRSTPIELAEGQRFEALMALTVFRVRADDAASGGAPHCSVYVLQATPRGLAEGRRSISCPDDGLAEVRPKHVRVQPVAQGRRQRLQGVLTGARASAPRSGRDRPEASAPERVDYAVTVRLRTDRGTIEGRVPPPAWPPPGAKKPTKALDRPPRGLSELWEAVMYPRRYARSRGG